MSGKILRVASSGTRRVTLRQGMDCKLAIKVAQTLGCMVKPMAGEVLITHPKFRRPVRINARKKDAPRILVAMLRKLTP